MALEQHDLTQDQRRPALRDDLAGERDRADLLVLHAGSIARPQARGSAEIARATPVAALARTPRSANPDLRSGRVTADEVEHVDMNGVARGLMWPVATLILIGST